MSMMNTNETSARELKRRALRYQKHKRPRKSVMPIGQRLTAWMMMLLAIALIMTLIGGRV